MLHCFLFFFFSSRRLHTRSYGDWSSDVCSSDLPDPDRRAAWLTFVVVGAGPTGVELAGQIGEIARDTLRRDFRSIDTRAARIVLVETVDRVLPGFPPRLSARAARALERLGVTPLVGRKVVEIDELGVAIGTTDRDAE